MKYRIVFLLILVLPLCEVQAKSEVMWGYGVNTGTASVRDPEGQTKTARERALFQLLYFNEYGRDSRYFAEVFIQDFDLPASVVDIGEEVEQKYLGFGLQKQLRFSQQIKPWFGAGLIVSQDEYRFRHTVDQDGFLDQRFDDRDETVLSVMVNAMTEFNLNRQYAMAFNTQYIRPIDEGVERVFISVIILYRM